MAIDYDKIGPQRCRRGHCPKCGRVMVANELCYGPHSAETKAILEARPSARGALLEALEESPQALYEALKGNQ